MAAVVVDGLCNAHKPCGMHAAELSHLPFMHQLLSAASCTQQQGSSAALPKRASLADSAAAILPAGSVMRCTLYGCQGTAFVSAQHAVMLVLSPKLNPTQAQLGVAGRARGVAADTAVDTHCAMRVIHTATNYWRCGTGGAFVGGDACMTAWTFQHWMQRLAGSGLHAAVRACSCCSHTVCTGSTACSAAQTHLCSISTQQ